MYSAWDYLSEVLDRTGSKELNFTKERLDAVKGRVPMIIIDGDHHKLMMGTPEAWPESEQRIDIIGQNGNDGEIYRALGDAFRRGAGFTQNGKHIPHDEVMRGNDDFEVDGA